MNKLAKSFRELEVYQVAFAFQQEVFERSKRWPREDEAQQREDGKSNDLPETMWRATERAPFGQMKEQMYALTDQLRRSTRSVLQSKSKSA